MKSSRQYDEFVVDIRVKNGALLRAILDAGHKNVAQFCKAERFSPTDVGDLLNMKVSPLHASGDWLPLVKRLSESLGPLPEELFPEATQIALQSNTRRLWVNSERALLLTAPDPLDEIALRDEVRAIVDRTTLAPRETELLRMQFEQEKSLDEMGQVLDVTRERVRQIGGRALERLRKSADDLGASTAICSFKAFESHVRTDPVIRSALNDEVPHSSALCVEALWNWYCSFQNDLVLAAEGRCMTPQEFGAVGPAHAKQVDAAMVEQIRLFAKRYRKKYPGLPA